MRKNINYEEKILVLSDRYRKDLTWNDVLKVQEKLNKEDVIRRFSWEEVDNNKSPFRMAMPDDPADYYYYLYLIVERTRLETDAEYVERLKREEDQKRQQEHRDYETYLQLKARFEK